MDYLDNPIGLELRDVYELEDEEEKMLLRENIGRRSRDSVLIGYQIQEDALGGSFSTFSSSWSGYVLLTTIYMGSKP